MSKPISTSTIRRYNLIAGFFHLAQMAVVLVLANDFSLPIVARYMSDAPGSGEFDQPTPLGELYVRWIGDDDVNLDSMREIDEFDSTQVQDFRSQLGDVDTSEPLSDKIGTETNE